jgi:hypothetical protein
MLCSVDDIFDAFGGPSAVGRVIGKSTEHAASMRRRGSIPVDYWPALIAHAREVAADPEQPRCRMMAHVTSDTLMLIHADRPPLMQREAV